MGCYRQRLNNDSPTKNARITSTLITTPAMAAARLPPRTHPLMLTISATGGVRNIVSPPRAERGDLHPGRRTTISTRAAGAASDSQKPTRPRFEGGTSGGIRPGSIVSMRAFRFSSLRPELDLDRFADRFHRRQVELDLDRDGFANQLFGHSP